ncbi:hypothetical protein HYU40_04115 [Candidatus Woesearchaeota archaeon]|nr:hypothetical protein [Candidatus Woesearchaeota archaeon]
MSVSQLIYCFCLLAFAASVTAVNSQLSNAAGFGVSPSSIEFVIEKGSSASRQLIIYNTGTDAQFTAVSENPAISAEPDNGMLKNGKSTAIKVTANGEKPGKSASEILVSLAHGSDNPDGKVRLSLGTRVRVSLTVIESAVQSADFFVGALTSAAITVAGLSAYLALRRKNVRLLPAKA